MQPSEYGSSYPVAFTSPFDFPPADSYPLEVSLPSADDMRLRTRKDSMASQASGSVYNESMEADVNEEDAEGEDENSAEEIIPTSPKKEYTRSRSGRRVLKSNYQESDDDEMDENQYQSPAPMDQDAEGSPDEEELGPRRRGLRSRGTRSQATMPAVFSSDDEEGAANGRRYHTRRQSRKPEVAAASTRATRAATRHSARPNTRNRRPPPRTRRSAQNNPDADNYVDDPDGSAGSSDGELDDVPRTSSDIEPEPDPEGEIEVGEDEDGIEQVDGVDGKPYALRRRAKVNYAIPPPLEEIPYAPPKERGNARSGGNKRKGPGWSANGAELGRFLGLPGPDDSDSDAPTRMPGRGLGGAALTGGLSAAGGLSDLAAAAGTPSNFGKVGDAALADADPLGVNQNVTFDEVGGLDDHINSLKEMTLLPLLYPEVFQRFGLTPPRGVLFHGPPGTGKTLLARALAASTRSNGKGISFFMRKGADVLSKWVGEAERQLRLLFEEARNCQPSIIFFDEIDGLAPVRSSKQDQIHASIVSTLLALMDGMDGRGQVVVIGATNRPDAVDPALRRPGRFDREFYFPLPNLKAREKILGIMTKNWEGWSGDKGGENLAGLAKLTKGYGGADLRALCTEAALNAVQRRYPQIYKSNDRLLLKPETIGVELRDFMISVKKIVPSSARSSSSAAAPLPTQLVPLLSEPLERVKAVLDKVMPSSKRRTALEEAEYEDEGPDGALERELMLQSMETLRVFRPRLVLGGATGMGQGYVANAVLHHLEGYHIQNLDLGSLLGDATRTPEAAIVQLFVEAKRHQPSVIYIPSLSGWCSAVSETARNTVQSMLNTLAPTDPILLFAVVDGEFRSLPRDVRAWFGTTRASRVEMSTPTVEQREKFFEDILRDIQRPPNEFPDGVARKKRVLEELPIAPPLAPRQPTSAELAAQQESDVKLLTLLKFRLGPILVELKKKHKRFTKPAMEEYQFPVAQEPVPALPIVIEPVPVENGDTGVDINDAPDGQPPDELMNGNVEHQEQAQMQLPDPSQPAEPVQPPEPLAPALPQLYDIDLERIHRELFNDRYLTPQGFLDDIAKIVHNARVCAHQDSERLVRAETMFNAAQLSIQDLEASFRVECERMAVRERQRRAERRKERRESARASAEAEARAASHDSSGGVRRSARNNGTGLEPDFRIRDPVALERRLKRHRSAEAQSQQEGGASAEGEEEREVKRSRVTSEEAPNGDAHDEGSIVNGIGFTAPLDVVQPPLPNGYTTQMDPELLIQSTSHVPLGIAAVPPVTGSDSLQQLPPFDPTAQMPPRIGGFDPSLLNPSSPSDRFIHHSGISEILQPPPSFAAGVEDQDTQMQSPTARHPAPSSSHATPPPASAISQTQPTSAESRMSVVERTPTPQPEFTVDGALLGELRTKLVRDTASLNVEQLEQLRASLLGAVWRRRTEWHRGALLHEMVGLVDEFVFEVRMDREEEDM